jgi:hypothetical protein
MERLALQHGTGLTSEYTPCLNLTNRFSSQYGCSTVSVYDYLNAPSPVTLYGCLNWEGTIYRNTFSTTAGFKTSEGS